MLPNIKYLQEKKLIGLSSKMSLTENKTFELFSNFMPRRKELLNAKGTEVFDLRVYPIDYFLNFNPLAYFTKWALMEVADFSNVPAGMKTFTLVEGNYAVFKHNGLITDNSVFQYIFKEWLPGSDYNLDNRPHFEILEARTKLNDPNSEQEIYIPIKSKQ